MAIQGTQVPTYINTHCFCIFFPFDFSKFLFFIFIWKTKLTKNEKKNNKNKLNKAMYKN